MKFDILSLLKIYHWRVTDDFGLVFSPRKSQKRGIIVTRSIAKQINKKIANMTDLEFERLKADFDIEDQQRLTRLRKIVVKMKQEGRTDRF